MMNSLYSIMTVMFLASSLRNHIQGSSCPETRRADEKDNSRFYYCIDLPFSSVGYVWIPANCNYGLVFQPLLKMCVVPKDDVCLNGIVNTDIHISEKKPIETPNTAPDIAAVLASKLQNLENIHNSQHTTVDKNGDNSYFSPTPPNIHTTNVKTAHATYKDITDYPVTAKTTLVTLVNQIQYFNSDNTADINRLPTSSLPPVLSTSPLTQRISTSSPKPIKSNSQDLPCTVGVRMPNLTDCTRYYMCNASSRDLYSYTCPEKMAFNAYKHVCEASIYAKCKEQITTESSLSIMITTVTTPSTNPCLIPGKMSDPDSRHHYYICYYHATKMERHRFACPNNLYYCASRKVCKKQNDCPDWHGIS
ncbi:uncharacterized protein [Periplaneta americana]|uniref:uncharacterized protein n=1 Tax=Periplaneta americana TaxID=6978 RepID=UPI0037E9B9B4